MLYESRANTEPPVKSTQEVAEEMSTPHTRPSVQTASRNTTAESDTMTAGTKEHHNDGT